MSRYAMNQRERIIIYGALAVLALVNIPHLLDGFGGRAMADADLTSGQLGPSDSLTLVDGEEKLVLRNRAGRLGWADNDYSRAYSVAFVHVGRAVGPLLEAEHYRDDYEHLEEEIRTFDEEIGQRITAFLEEHRDVKADDPDAEQVQRAYQELLGERENWRREGTMRLGKLAAEQIEQAYRDLVAAVEVVAQRRGIDIVFRFIPTANDFDAQNPPQAYTSVRARIALTYPKEIDITEEVLEELDIEVE